MGLAGCGGGNGASQAPAATPLPTLAAVLTPQPTLTPDPATPVADTRAEVAAGMALIQAQCAACHAMTAAGISGPVQPVGPSLDGEGARRSRAWLLTQLVNPCAHRTAGDHQSCTRMPSFASLTQQQLAQIVAALEASR